MDNQGNYNYILRAVEDGPLKVMLLLHLIFTVFGLQGYWCPDSYLFYNSIFFITLLWSIRDKDSADAPILCFFIDALSIIFDVVTLCVFFPGSKYGAADRFSVAMAILNLVLRPLSCLMIYKVFSRRNSPEVEVRGGAEYSPYQP